MLLELAEWRPVLLESTGDSVEGDCLCEGVHLHRREETTAIHQGASSREHKSIVEWGRRGLPAGAYRDLHNRDDARREG